MTKSKYQDSAMEYARNYLDRLLEMEDYVGQRVEKILGAMVEQKVRDYLEKENERKRLQY